MLKLVWMRGFMKGIQVGVGVVGKRRALCKDYSMDEVEGGSWEDNWLSEDVTLNKRVDGEFKDAVATKLGLDLATVLLNKLAITLKSLIFKVSASKHRLTHKEW